MRSTTILFVFYHKTPYIFISLFSFFGSYRSFLSHYLDKLLVRFNDIHLHICIFYCKRYFLFFPLSLFIFWILSLFYLYFIIMLYTFILLFFTFFLYFFWIVSLFSLLLFIYFLVSLQCYSYSHLNFL